MSVQIKSHLKLNNLERLGSLAYLLHIIIMLWYPASHEKVITQ